MREAWIPLECPSCGEQWERNPADLPAPTNEFTYEHCGDERPIAEFIRTPEGLEIHEEFHSRDHR